MKYIKPMNYQNELLSHVQVALFSPQTSCRFIGRLRLGSGSAQVLLSPVAL